MIDLSRFRYSIAALALVVSLLAIAIAAYIWTHSTRTILTPQRGDGKSFKLSFDAGGRDSDWYVSDFAFKSSFFRARWVPENVHENGTSISLELNRKPADHQPYSGAEVQRGGFYGFGRYEVVMRAAPGSGAVSSFFTHTDETFGDPHDEIDIEFLGNNTRRLHANLFAAGRTEGAIYIDLPFDAATEVHLYAFEWQPDSVKWFVDDQLVKTITSAERPIPQTKSRIIMNIWTGSKDQIAWHGPPEFEDGTTASYYCISFQLLGDTTNQCSDTFGRQKL